MKILHKMMVAGAVVAIVTQGAFAQMENLTKLDIKEIQKIQFVENGANLDANTTLKFTNASDQEVVIKNAKFNVGLKVAGQPLAMGIANVAELSIPGTKTDSTDPNNPIVTTGETVQMMAVRVGPKDDATIQRLLAIFNVFGDPSAQYTMTLVGDCDVGFRTANGLIMQKGISVEFEFAPTYKPSVLAK